jgi:hypothetical protein
VEFILTVDVRTAVHVVTAGISGEPETQKRGEVQIVCFDAIFNKLK